MVRVSRSRWSVLVRMVALSALCVTPLACVLNCLLGGCTHAVQAQTQLTTTAHVTLSIGGAATITTPATPPPLAPTLAAPRSRHHCCAVKNIRRERLVQPAVEASAPPATPTSVSLAGRSTLPLGTNGLTTGSMVATVGADDARCRCHHAATPDRFTVAPAFTFEAPLAPPPCTPVRLPIARRFSGFQPPAVVAYQPSRRETYLMCCVFRI